MTDVNNPITDALDEMLSLEAEHMVLQTNDHPQFLIHGERKVSTLPVMTAEEIIEDCLALGMNRRLMEDCNFFYSPGDTNESHVFKVALTGQDDNFFIVMTYRETVARYTDEEWVDF